MDVISENVPSPKTKIEDNLECIIDLEAQSTCENVQKWYDDITQRIYQSTQFGNEKYVDDMMVTYYRCLKEKTFSNKDKFALTEKVLAHIKYFYLYYKEIEPSLVDTNYFKRMEDILTYYCSLELESVHHLSKQRENRKHFLFIVKRLFKVLGIYLHHKLKHILHVLLKMNYNTRNPCCQMVMRKLYFHFLMSIPAEPLSDEVFCRYYLIFERYKSVEKPEDRKKLDDIVFVKFGKTREFLTTNPLMKAILTPVCGSVTDVVTHILDFNATTIQAYFDYLKNSQMDEMPQLSTNIDTQCSSNDFSKTYNDVLCTFSEASITVDNNTEPLCIDSDSDIETIEEEGTIVVSEEDDIDIIYREKTNKKTKKKPKILLKDCDVINLDSDDELSDRTTVSPLRDKSATRTPDVTSAAPVTFTCATITTSVTLLSPLEYTQTAISSLNSPTVTAPVVSKSTEEFNPIRISASALSTLPVTRSDIVSKSTMFPIKEELTFTATNDSTNLFMSMASPSGQSLSSSICKTSTTDTSQSAKSSEISTLGLLNISTSFISGTNQTSTMETQIYDQITEETSTSHITKFSQFSKPLSSSIKTPSLFETMTSSPTLDVEPLINKTLLSMSKLQLNGDKIHPSISPTSVSSKETKFPQAPIELPISPDLNKTKTQLDSKIQIAPENQTCAKPFVNSENKLNSVCTSDASNVSQLTCSTSQTPSSSSSKLNYTAPLQNQTCCIQSSSTIMSPTESLKLEEPWDKVSILQPLVISTGVENEIPTFTDNITLSVVKDLSSPLGSLQSPNQCTSLSDQNCNLYSEKNMVASVVQSNQSLLTTFISCEAQGECITDIPSVMPQSPKMDASLSLSPTVQTKTETQDLWDKIFISKPPSFPPITQTTTSSVTNSILSPLSCAKTLQEHTSTKIEESSKLREKFDATLPFFIRENKVRPILSSSPSQYSSNESTSLVKALSSKPISSNLMVSENQNNLIGEATHSTSVSNIVSKDVESVLSVSKNTTHIKPFLQNQKNEVAFSTESQISTSTTIEPMIITSVGVSTQSDSNTECCETTENEILLSINPVCEEVTDCESNKTNDMEDLNILITDVKEDKDNLFDSNVEFPCSPNSGVIHQCDGLDKNVESMQTSSDLPLQARLSASDLSSELTRCKCDHLMKCIDSNCNVCESSHCENYARETKKRKLFSDTVSYKFQMVTSPTLPCDTQLDTSLKNIVITKAKNLCSNNSEVTINSPTIIEQEDRYTDTGQNHMLNNSLDGVNLSMFEGKANGDINTATVPKDSYADTGQCAMSYSPDSNDSAYSNDRHETVISSTPIPTIHDISSNTMHSVYNYLGNHINQKEENERNTSSAESIDPQYEIEYSKSYSSDKLDNEPVREEKIKNRKDRKLKSSLKIKNTKASLQTDKNDKPPKILFTPDEKFDAFSNELDSILSGPVTDTNSQYFENSVGNFNLFNYANSVPAIFNKNLMLADKIKEIDSPPYDVLESDDIRHYIKNEFIPYNSAFKLPDSTKSVTNDNGHTSGKFSVSFNDSVDKRCITPAYSTPKRNRRSESGKNIKRGGIKRSKDGKVDMVVNKVSDNELLNKCKVTNHNTLRTCIRKKIDSVLATNYSATTRNNILSKGSTSCDGLHENIKAATSEGQRIVMNGQNHPTRRRGRPRKFSNEEESYPRKRRKKTILDFYLTTT